MEAVNEWPHKPHLEMVKSLIFWYHGTIWLLAVRFLNECTSSVANIAYGFQIVQTGKETVREVKYPSPNFFTFCASSETGFG
jgi:hypothetical protein